MEKGLYDPKRGYFQKTAETWVKIPHKQGVNKKEQRKNRKIIY